MVFDHCLSLMAGRGRIVGVLRIFLFPLSTFFLVYPQSSSKCQVSGISIVISLSELTQYAQRWLTKLEQHVTRTQGKKTLKSVHVVGARGQDSGISARNYTGLNLPLPSRCIKVQSTAITTLKQRI